MSKLTFSYTAFDGQNHINRQGIDGATLALHASNLIVSGYIVSATQDDSGRKLDDDELFAMAASR